MPKLTIITGQRLTTKVSLRQPEVQLGRADENDLVLDDVSVSRHHARIFTANGHYFLEDLGSQAGTFLNSQRIQREQLVDGDEIRIGGYCLLYQEDIEGVPLGKTVLRDTDDQERTPPPGEVAGANLFDDDWAAPGLAAGAPAALLDERLEDLEITGPPVLLSSPLPEERSVERSDTLDELVEPLFVEEELAGLRGAPASPRPAPPAPSSPPAKLVILHKGNVVREEKLSGFDLSLGRDKSNDIVLEGIEVSRFHAKITHRDEAYQVEDLGSSNGTFVNHRKVDKAPIGHGCEIQIGNFTLLFRRPLEAEADAVDTDAHEILGADRTDVFHEEDVQRLLADHGDRTLIEAEEQEAASTQLAAALADAEEGDEVGADWRPLGGPAAAAPARSEPARESEAGAAPLVLVGLDRGFKGQEFVLHKDQVTVGREESLDLMLKDDSISRTHALIVRGPVRYEVQDLGSTNGTRLNGELIDRAPLQSGDRVAFGNVTLLVRSAGGYPDLPSAKAVRVQQHRQRSPAFLVALVTTVLVVLSAAVVAWLRQSSVQAPRPADAPETATAPAASAELFRQHLARGDLDAARAVLAALRSAAEGDPGLRPLEEELAAAEADRRTLDQARAALNVGAIEDAVALAAKVRGSGSVAAEARRLADQARAALADKLVRAATEHRDQGQLAEARRELLKALELVPKHPGALAAIETVNARQGTSPGRPPAAGPPRQPPAPPPAEPEPSPVNAAVQAAESRAAELIAEAYRAYGASGPEAALRIIESALSLPLPGDSPQRERLERIAAPIVRLEGLLEEGEQALGTGNLEGAATAWNAALDLEMQTLPTNHAHLARALTPRLASLETQRGEQALAQGQLAKAYTRFHAALRLNSGDAQAQRRVQEIDNQVQALYREAYIYVDTDQARAQAGFERILQMVPPDHEYYQKARDKLQRLR